MIETRTKCAPTYLLCTNKKEYLSCGRKEFVLDRCGVMFALLDLSVDNIHDAHNMATMPPMTTNASVDILAAIETFEKVEAKIQSEMFARLVVSLASVQMEESERRLSQVAFSGVEQREIQERIENTEFNEYCIPINPVLGDPDYMRREGATKNPGKENSYWRYWDDILSRTKVGEGLLSSPDEFLRELCNKAQFHLERVQDILVEVEKLKKTLPFNLDGGSWGNLFNEALEDVSPCSQSYIESFPNLSSMSSVVYHCRSLTSIVALELESIKNSYGLFKNCSLCGKYFLPYNSNAQYCHRPNPDLGGEPCIAVGSYITYKAKCKSKKVYYEYNKHYKTYHKWVSENKYERDWKNENNKLKYREKGKKREKDYVDEINANFNNWCYMANTHLSAFVENKITEEECVLLIALPNIKERSPLLYDINHIR